MTFFSLFLPHLFGYAGFFSALVKRKGRFNVLVEKAPQTRKAKYFIGIIIGNSKDMSLITKI